METLAVVYIFLVTVLGTQGQVISEPNDTTVCEGRSTTFTCVLDKNYRNINSDNVQWRKIRSAAGVLQQGSNIHSNTSTTNNTLTTTLTITNAMKSYAGNYFVNTPYYSGCYAFLTVTTRPPALTVNITKNIESSSIVIQWDEVDHSLPITYAVTWTSERDLNNVQAKTVLEQSSYTITGLTLDTVYTVTVAAQNSCGTGPEYSTSVSLTTDTTSGTSTLTAITNTTAITSAPSSSTSTAITKSSTITITASNAMINPSTTKINPITTSGITEATNLMTSSTNPSVVITNTNTVTDTMSPVSTMNPIDATTDDENSNSSVYIIVGVIIGVILVLSLLFIIMICYFIRRKGKNDKKNEYSDLTGNGTLDKNMQMVPNSLSTNGQDEKPAKLEAEPSYDTVEVHYMMSNIGSANTNSKQRDVLDKSPSKEKLDSENRQPIEYAVVDKSKKTKKKDNQKKVDDPQKDTDDVPVVTAPHNNDQTIDGVNQNTNNPTIHYAELERLPKATGNYLAKDDSSKQYALVV